MFPIIVIEGPDAAGKSTLGEFLKKRWAARYQHLTYRFPDAVFTYHWAALEWALKRGKDHPVILDRWWPSEIIYANVFRGGSKWPMGGRLLDRAGLPQGVIYVACIPGDEQRHIATFEARAKEGGEMFDKVLDVAVEYRQWYEANAHRPDFIRYDVYRHGQDMGAFADRLWQRALEYQNRIPWWFQKERQFGGQPLPRARFLLIGERTNPKHRHEVWPFFEHANSSLWLTEVLECASVPESDVVWMNAFDKEGWASPTKIEQVVKHLEPQTIVALGTKAERVAWSAGIHRLQNFRTLPHPAYVKRFQRGDQTEYVELLKVANDAVRTR